MKEPFNITFPIELAATAKVLHECSDDFRYQISYAKPVQTTLPGIKLLKQFYSGSSVYIAMIQAEIAQRVDVVTKVEEAVLAFFYGMEGDISFQMKGIPEMVFIQKGKCFMVYVPAGEYPSPLLPGKSMAVYFVLHQRLMKKVAGDYPEYAAAFQKLLNNDPEPGLFHLADISKAMHSRLLKLGQYKEQKKLGMESVILSLVNDLIEAQLQQVNARQYSSAGRLEIAFRVYEYVQFHAYMGPLEHIDKIAAEFNIGYDTLLRVFKKTFGLTLKDFINKEKMDAARYLLTSDGLSVMDVSQRLGYGDPQSFSRLFKAHFGYPPSEAQDHKTK